MKQHNSTTIHGGVSGNGNNFNNNNYNVKNVRNVRNVTKKSGDGGGSDGEGIALIGAIFAALVVTAYLYLWHFDSIFFWLKVGVVLAGAIHVTTFAPYLRDPDFDYRDSWPTALGVFLVACQAWLLMTAADAMPQEALNIAHQPTAATGLLAQAFEVWNRFNANGHRIVIENMMAVLLLAPSVVLNVFLGLQNLLESMGRSEDSAAFTTVAQSLRIFKGRGSTASVIFVTMSVLASSGIFSPHLA